MAKREQDQCTYYHDELQRSQSRLAEIKAQGISAMSRYDIEIAHCGDAKQELKTAKWLVGNHIRYFTEKVAACDRTPRQATLFEMIDSNPGR